MRGMRAHGGGPWAAVPVRLVRVAAPRDIEHLRYVHVENGGAVLHGHHALFYSVRALQHALVRLYGRVCGRTQPGRRRRQIHRADAPRLHLGHHLWPPPPPPTSLIVKLNRADTVLGLAGLNQSELTGGVCGNNLL